MIDRLRLNWPVVSLVVSGGLLAGAHAFQTFGHLAPCEMCLAQRDWHWSIVALAIAGMLTLRTRPLQARWVAFALAIAYLGSFAMAGMHVGVEHHWIQETCGGNHDFGDLSFRGAAQTNVVRCDTPQWNLFGVTMAGYNALISLAMAVASVAIAFAPERKA